MEQTPIHHHPNLDLLNVLPGVQTVVEAGVSSGALAKAYKQQHPYSHYTGIEIDPEFAAIAEQYCDRVLVADLDGLTAINPPRQLRAECWVFGDCLEHLADPWRVLRWVHQLQPNQAWVCACIPNAQHWSLQARLSTGDLFYQQSGLFDRTHLRWFTKKTMIDLFESSGYAIETIQPRLIQRQPPAALMHALRELALAAGGHPEQAEEEAKAFQYIIRAKRNALIP
jgi:hypothetical protein